MVDEANMPESSLLYLRAFCGANSYTGDEDDDDDD